MTDTKSLETQLSMESGHNVDVIEAEVKAIVDALGDFCAQGDSVAIPGFGTFQSVKTDEHIATDDEGRRMLMPPSITVEFKSSVVLRKSLN
ncbi:MAG: HU family DNA-binding protein [Paramuribaculum sp.]|nr:HU family DNA-binding protein [Paramuribaculum sp.]